MVDNKVSVETCKAISGNINNDINEIKTDIKLIKENHLAHIERSLVEISVSNGIKNKIIWMIVGTIITSLVLYFMKAGGLL